MRSQLRILLTMGAAVAALGSAASTFASDAPVVLDLEGNPTCNSLTVNTITTLSDNSVDPGPFTLTQGSQTITGSVSSPDQHVLESWTATVPVNFVILKGQGNAGARVYHFGQSGVTSDTDAEGPGTTTQIAQLTFCYGLSGTTIPPTPVAECTVEDFGVQCVPNGPREVFFVLDPDEPLFGVRQCVCNDELEQCDPSLPVGTSGACPKAGQPLTEVTTFIEATKNPGTYYCITSGGRRKCFSD